MQHAEAGHGAELEHAADRDGGSDANELPDRRRGAELHVLELAQFAAAAEEVALVGFQTFSGFLTAIREEIRAIFQVARTQKQGVSAPPGRNRPGSRSAETESLATHAISGGSSGPLSWREIPSLLTVKLAFLALKMPKPPCLVPGDL